MWRDSDVKNGALWNFFVLWFFWGCFEYVFWGLNTEDDTLRENIETDQNTWLSFILMVRWRSSNSHVSSNPHVAIAFHLKLRKTSASVNFMGLNSLKVLYITKSRARHVISSINGLVCFFLLLWHEWMCYQYVNIQKKVEVEDKNKRQNFNGVLLNELKESLTPRKISEVKELKSRFSMPWIELGVIFRI